MASVYILYSNIRDSFYIGSCLDFENRLSQHLNGEFDNAYTKRNNDWEEFLIVENLQYICARNIEGHIKKMKSKKYIQDLKKYPDIVEKLKKKYCAGSSR